MESEGLVTEKTTGVRTEGGEGVEEDVTFSRVRTLFGDQGTECHQGTDYVHV